MKITSHQRASVYWAMGGYMPERCVIANAMATYDDQHTGILEKRLKHLEREFQQKGGRGVDLAEDIDAIRIVLAMRA